MFTENGGRPGDERGFIHKSKFGRFVGGAVKTLVPGISTAVNVIQTGRSIFRGGRTTPRPTVPRVQTARVTETSAEQKRAGAELKFGFTGDTSGLGPTDFQPRRPGIGPRRIVPEGPCDFPKVRDPATGFCRDPTSGQFGGEQFGVGAAVMGRYGAALEPGSRIIDRAICLRGMQLGNDGLCYNKSQISNKQRMWPAGRKPLLTGGDVRAIGIASRAARRLEATTKRLQRMGMLKKPASRRLPAHAHARAAKDVVSI